MYFVDKFTLQVFLLLTNVVKIHVKELNIKIIFEIAYLII